MPFVFKEKREKKKKRRQRSQSSSRNLKGAAGRNVKYETSAN
jgi:hypothetical protein